MKLEPKFLLDLISAGFTIVEIESERRKNMAKNDEDDEDDTPSADLRYGIANGKMTVAAYSGKTQIFGISMRKAEVQHMIEEATKLVAILPD